MKYLLALFFTLIATESMAAKFPTQTFTADGTKVVATLPTSNGMWKGEAVSYGDFGGGTLTLIYSTNSTCNGSPVSEVDRTGTAYSATDDDMALLEHGIDRNENTYVCATLTGATNPNMTVTVRDLR